MSKIFVEKLPFFAFILFYLSPVMIFQILEGIEQKQSHLQEVYQQSCNTTEELSAHLPLLRQLAKECSSVTEISCSPISQWAILSGLSEARHRQRSYLGIHLEYPPVDQLNLAKQLATENHIQFTFWRVNDLHITLEPTDMLFIHSVPTYCQLKYELETFSSKVRKYICIPYTSTWKEQNGPNNLQGLMTCPNSKTKKGLWPAIADFIDRHPEWVLVEHLTDHGGFTILKRLDENAVLTPTYDRRVNSYLKDKIILCTGPALNHFDLLKTTTESDMELIPFKKIFVTTQDPNVMNVTFKGKKPVCALIPNQGKQLDCTNCIFICLRNAVNDPEVKDDDIILFKHETLFINDMHLIKKAIEKLVHGFSLVDRNKRRYRNYWSTDVFFVKVATIRKLVEDYQAIKFFPQGSKICEHYFSQKLVQKIPKVYEIPYDHGNGYFTELGFYHLPSYNNKKQPWDKANYDQLFK